MNISELKKQRAKLLQEICKFPVFRPRTSTTRYRKWGRVIVTALLKTPKGMVQAGL